MWPTSNGYNYTDSHFKCTLPELSDNVGNIIQLIHPTTDITTHTTCDVCDTPLQLTPAGNPSTTTIVILPCVIQGSRNPCDPDVTYAVYPGEGRPTLVYEAAAHFATALCPDCQERAFTLMKTSDHATRASEDWDDLASNLALQLTDPGWAKYDYKAAREALARRVAKTMVLLENATNAQLHHNPDATPTNLFALLPQDLLHPLSKHLLRAEEDRLATKIQSLYRSWRSRFWHPSRRWDHTVSHKGAQDKNLWTICDDCGTCRPVRDTIVMDACADHGGCCYKTVCSTFCLYSCPAIHDDGSRCNADIYVHQDDKNHNGEPTHWTCHECDHDHVLNEQWHGLSETDYNARYG